VSCGDVEIDVNRQNRGGATPLHDAVQFASEDIVDILLTSAPGLDVRPLAGRHHCVADCRAIVSCRCGAVRQVNVGDKMGATPLILAAHRGREAIVARLIHHEANVNAYTVIGTTGLPLATPLTSLFFFFFLVFPQCKTRTELTELFFIFFFSRAWTCCSSPFGCRTGTRRDCGAAPRQGRRGQPPGRSRVGAPTPFPLICRVTSRRWGDVADGPFSFRVRTAAVWCHAIPDSPRWRSQCRPTTWRWWRSWSAPARA
jgi:hypothetical protein